MSLRSRNELLGLCLRLGRFKKENKELLAYLLFESSDERAYINRIKTEIDEKFGRINTTSIYFIKKSIRKILKDTRKYIRSTQKKETEVELLIYFCNKMSRFNPPILNVLGARAFGDPPAVAAASQGLYRAWETADGHVVVVVIEDRQFEAVCRAIGRDDLVGDARYATLLGRLQNAPALFELLESELRRWKTSELIERARQQGATLAAVNSLDDFLADAQVQANQPVATVTRPETGPVPVMRSAPRFGGALTEPSRPPPLLGEHTTEVLREAGLSDAEIAALG